MHDDKRIREAQKHVDPVDPDPQHRFNLKDLSLGGGEPVLVYTRRRGLPGDDAQLALPAPGGPPLLHHPHRGRQLPDQARTPR